LKKEKKMSFKIGDIQIDNSVVVAPMAGISNSAFRVTVKEFGAGLVVCEMISDKGIQFRNEKTLSMLHIEPNEYPLSVQIMGGNKDTLVEAAKYVAENTEAAIIDINMGCSAPDIVKSGAGAAWLSKDTSETRAMVRSVKDALSGSGKRLSVKLRLGDEHFTDERFFSLCDMLASEGVTLFALHPRTSKEKYRSPLRREYVERLALRYAGDGISVVLNGGVRDVPSMHDALCASPHASGIMIARGGIEKPWLFAELAADLRHESFDAVTSNYVYHNITGVNKQALLLETLRVLKKGGVFAIHDLMSRSRYGDMDAFVADLKAKGYEKAELIDTTQGMFMTPKEAKSLQLAGSTLLVGKK